MLRELKVPNYTKIYKFLPKILYSTEHLVALWPPLWH